MEIPEYPFKTIVFNSMFLTLAQNINIIYIKIYIDVVEAFVSDNIVFQRTALFEKMLQAGGKMVDFHGWELPVQFSGIPKEHAAVRNNCGLFDVSHMGQVFIEGPDAYKFVEYINTNRIKNVEGAGVYSHILTEDGGIIDDAITFCLKETTKFLIVVNAGTRDKDFAWFNKQAANFNVKLNDESDEYQMVALQGPKAAELMKEIFPSAFGLARFNIMTVNYADREVLISRTGYTGEDGFEIAADAQTMLNLWDVLFDKGEKYGLLPCGLGVRDVLRLESGYLLYGEDIDESRTPYEAACAWVVKLQKEAFIGKEALIKKKEAGFAQKLTGLILKDRGIARPGCKVFLGGEEIGSLTSATYSPSLAKSIGWGYLKNGTEPGTEVEVEIRGNKAKAEIVKPPFYSKKA